MAGLNVEPSLNRKYCPIENMSRGERLIINSLRRWIFDKKSMPRISRRFRNDLGCGPGRLAIEGFCALANLLTTSSRRAVFIRYPSCSNVSTDERTIIALIAAAQHNQHLHVSALTRWVFPLAVQTLAIAYVSMVAIALKDGGCTLTRPAATPLTL